MKTCSKCSNLKEPDQFFKDKSKSDGLTSRCKLCIYEKTSQYQKVNSSKRTIWNKTYSLKNRDKIKEYTDSWWEEKGRQLATDYKRNRRRIDPLYKLASSLRGLVAGAFRSKGYTKSTQTHIIIGCSFNEFKLHLESKFETWMKWENHGKYNGEFNYGWDIDHVIPLSTAKTEDDLIKLNHYTNLQPLCGKVNRYIKRNKN
jgi:NOL1/NOP2/fmu family ribosome biogenesis protein